MKVEEINIFDSYKKVDNQLDVVKVDFESVESLSWQELFEGYDKLYAITYSSGISFIYELINKFEYTEIIFGYEGVLTYSLQEIIAYQQKTIERIIKEEKKTKLNLVNRLDEQSLKMYVTREQISHEKVYLLESKEGKKRVITGSANMSYSAFSGNQRENIICFDSDKAFDWYMESFLELKDNSTDNIVKKNLILSEDINIEDLPIAETVKVKKVLVIEPEEKKTKEEVNFILDVNMLSKRLELSMPKKNKKGKILLSPEVIKRTRRRYETYQSKEKAYKAELPSLDIDIDGKKVVLNGMELDLKPNHDDIKDDINLLVEYMGGYEKYHLGDIKKLQNSYYKFIIWFFISPFLARMRNIAIQYNHNLMTYPMFGVIYGNSKAGKTTLLETILKMMVGQSPIIEANDFTRTNIHRFKNEIKGVPIIVDDINQNRFRTHAVEVIKADNFGSAENNNSYPIVAITANEDVKALTPEIIRRTVICHVDVRIKNTDMMKLSTVQKVQNNIGTALYREFLRNMIEIIPEMVNLIKDENREGGVDLFNKGSEILYNIFSNYLEEDDIPNYVRILNLGDYFDERITGAKAIKTLKEAWSINRSAFEVNKKRFQLIYNAKETWLANNLGNELPEDLGVIVSRELVIMDLEKAGEYLEINFIKENRLINKIINNLSRN